MKFSCVCNCGHGEGLVPSKLILAIFWSHPRENSPQTGFTPPPVLLFSEDASVEDACDIEPLVQIGQMTHGAVCGRFLLVFVG